MIKHRFKFLDKGCEISETGPTLLMDGGSPVYHPTGEVLYDEGHPLCCGELQVFGQVELAR